MSDDHVSLRGLASFDGEPAGGPDVDRVVADGRRTVGRRRLAVGTTAAVAVVVGGALLVGLPEGPATPDVLGGVVAPPVEEDAECAALYAEVLDRTLARGASPDDARSNADSALADCRAIAAFTPPPPPAEVPPSACASDAPDLASPADVPTRRPGEVLVLATCDGAYGPLPDRLLTRSVPEPATADAALEQAVLAWLGGTTDAEQAEGYRTAGVLSDRGPGYLLSARIESGTAVIDLSGELATVNNLTTSTNASSLQAEATAAGLQVEGVTEVRLTLDGSCEALAILLELSTCVVGTSNASEPPGS